MQIETGDRLSHAIGERFLVRNPGKYFSQERSPVPIVCLSGKVTKILEFEPQKQISKMGGQVNTTGSHYNEFILRMQQERDHERKIREYIDI